MSSANYTAGGNTLGTPSVTYDTATDETRLDMADTSWSSVTFTARYAVVYKSTGTASTSALIALIDFGGDQAVSSGTFSITFDSTGVIKADSS